VVPRSWQRPGPMVLANDTDNLRQALEIFHLIRAAEVPDLLAELNALTGPPPAR
jgi:hypothetical protein